MTAKKARTTVPDGVVVKFERERTDGYDIAVTFTTASNPNIGGLQLTAEEAAELSGQLAAAAFKSKLCRSVEKSGSDKQKADLDGALKNVHEEKPDA